jgi:hypothetical protein
MPKDDGSQEEGVGGRSDRECKVAELARQQKREGAGPFLGCQAQICANHSTSTEDGWMDVMH